MRNINQKKRCVKRALPKFTSVCKTYDKVQEAYASRLSDDDEIVEIQCNVPIEDTSIGEFTSDFVFKRRDGTIAVRECTLRTKVLRPRTVTLLDFSQRYWLKKGITDWKVIIDAEKK